MAQFKFVGGPSRKRRRRNETKPTGTAPVRDTAHRQLQRGGENELDNTQTQAHASTQAQTHTQPETSLPPQPLDKAPTASSPFPKDIDLFLNWPNNSTSLNSFLDTSLVFDDPLFLTNTQFQLGNLKSSEMDFAQELSPPSRENSLDSFRPSIAQIPDPGQIGDFYADAAHFAIPPAREPSKGEAGFTEAWKRLIARYDKEFCVLPLTKDFDANPFRHNLETSKGSQLLLHCILALSYKHVNRTTGNNSAEVSYHKQRAVQLLRGMEGQAKTSRIGQTFLDAILILMTLDCATSASGPWLQYLHRAHSILEATEQLNLPKTPRMKAQIGMLAWWDVTLAMTSRQGTVLSDHLILSQLKPPDPSRSRCEGSFYNISGCPEDLFKHMVALGAYAHEFEVASTMKCVTFNMAPVLALESAIRSWSAPEFSDAAPAASTCTDTPSKTTEHPEKPPEESQSEETAQYTLDTHHCAESWRYGLLIYIERVFKARHDKDSPLMLEYLARRALNNVRCCRRALMLQKQLLLPVFLAGCETSDEVLRQEAREYCTWWNEETGYNMFLTARGLMEEVWEEKGHGGRGGWWGSVIDEKTGGANVSYQYLFG